MTSAPRARVARRPVHGVLLLDKPLGWSSNDVLQKVKWLLRAEKAGGGMGDRAGIGHRQKAAHQVAVERGGHRLSMSRTYVTH